MRFIWQDCLLKKVAPKCCQNCITVSGIFNQSPVENSGQGPVNFFQARSAQNFSFKVRLKIFRQGLMQFSRVSTRRSDTHARTFQSRSDYFFSCKVCLKLFNQGLLEKFHARSGWSGIIFQSGSRRKNSRQCLLEFSSQGPTGIPSGPHPMPLKPQGRLVMSCIVKIYHEFCKSRTVHRILKNLNEYVFQYNEWINIKWHYAQIG